MMHFYADPLADFRIDALSDFVGPIGKKYGYESLGDHIHEILFTFIFYDMVYRLSGVISPSISKGYRSLSHRTQINFDIHVASMVNCLILLVLIFPMFNDPILALDKVLSYTPYGGFVCSVACGYFLWDAITCLRFMKLFGPGFAIHGVSALFVFIQSLRPYIVYYAPHFLLFELSTPFLNIHWFSSHLPAGLVPSWIVTINGILLLITFFSARIIWGFYQAFYFALEVFSVKNRTAVPLWLPITILTSNMTLNTLNVYWFSKMIQLATRKFSGSSKKEHKE